MGAGTVIASAIIIVLLIITGYVLIGGTLTSAQIVMAAQRAAAEKEGQRIHTQIEIFHASTNTTSTQAFIEVNNTGSEVVRDFDHMEVYLLQGTEPYTYTNLSGSWTYTISPDVIHPNLLDPDEVANITVLYDPAGGDPSWVKVTTANGVYTSKYIPA
ncbi:MAG: flagellar protein FlaF [Methanomicrobiales archaeon]|nr:flagellar protein FlaF [Methanomicrobiales archaeon]